VVLALAAFGPLTPTLAAGEKEHHLALLVAAPHDGEGAMQNDLSAMYNALTARGLQPHEIMTMGGPISRKLLMAFLEQAADLVAPWDDGVVFLAYSGHGSFTGTSARDARAALQLATGEVVPWQDVFRKLRLPAGVRLALLADC
jgi:hypothetical protein